MRIASLIGVLLICGLRPSAGSSGPAALKAGDAIAGFDFERPDALAEWPGRAGSIALDEGYRGGRALRIDSADAAAGAHADLPLPAEKLRGRTLLLSAMVKARDVSARPQPWNGIKFMVPIQTPAGRLWPQASIGVGTFDWTRVTWQVHVPPDATQALLRLGLEGVTGRVWFDDVRLAVRRPPARLPASRPAGQPIYRGHDLPRLRGAMVSPDASAEDLRTLGRDWNANLIRWQLCGFRPRIDTGDLPAYNAFLEEHLRRLDRALPVCREVGLMVVVDLHTGPGHWAEPGKSLFTSRACQDRFVEIWEQIARRYRDAPCVWAYDLLNEPPENAVAEDALDWQGLAERAARAIRRIDPVRPIIVEPAPGGGPEALWNLQPIDVPKVIYSVHMYHPSRFTHQGVFDRTDKPLAYPGRIDGQAWDKARIEAALKTVVEWQRACGAHIYIGEFSAIRWAPDGSAFRYIRDCIDIFEELGWDWTYHAFREWNGWSVEHGGDRADDAPAPPGNPTDRQKLLMEWFARNRKPGWHKPK